MTEGAEQGTNEAMTENLELGQPEAALPPATSLSQTPPQPLPG